MQTRHWIFTINNWTSEEDDYLRSLSESQVSYLVIGYEHSESGTPHMQGYVCTSRKKRLSEIKRLICERGHFEPKRGTAEQASTYCKKDGVFYEYGVLPVGSGSGGIFNRFKTWALSFADAHGRPPSDKEIAKSDFGHLWLQYGSRMQQFCGLISPGVKLVPEEVELKPWQRDLESALTDTPPDDRSILFYVDEEGGKGKTWFQRYMVTKYPDDVQLLSVGKRDDVAHAIDASKGVFLFNIPRGGMEFFNYHVVEQLKDRLVFSPKYNSSMKTLLKNPHVVIFCNESPDEEKMTADRFIIETI
jgi:hypothetical protein